MNQIPIQTIVNSIITDPAVRKAATRESLLLFLHVYFPHYIKYETAEFQQEIISHLEDEAVSGMMLAAFRGSAKSTIVTMAYVLWAILGKQQKKFVIIGSQTQRQARQLLQNIRQELETNHILRKDLGPFQEDSDEWGSLSLTVTKYGARITAASTEQSIRGLRHGQYRPDLIILDDIEDLASVKTYENRDKTFRWFTGDIVPAGDLGTRIIVVGNLLHHDSLIMKLKKAIEDKQYNGRYLEYPLIKDEKILWPGKYPDQEAVDTERRRTGSTQAWQREYLLQIVPDEDQVIYPQWITYYDTILDPKQEENEFREAISAVDPAISEKQSADCTAVVSAKVFGSGKTIKIFIMPKPINARLPFPAQLEIIRKRSETLGGGQRTRLLIESNGYQQALIQKLREERFLVEPIAHTAMDKRSRLSLISPYIQAGNVVFPKQGAEQLIAQLIGFGSEKHDDLVDALVMVIQFAVNRYKSSPDLSAWQSKVRPEPLALSHGYWYKQF